ncbi:cystathionine gamma-synthase [Streptococcus himalayensis]|uniref:homocysteine desulfhydrase n=1 Tax=Streptococcus himalayensis TaxID=1888195 RepID=A0A917A6B2_9STRE|nr:cystathionine gamma-synthase [Streptococcus himalayensis]GGE29164.1 cystathionine gamma-synthase [Streptococcus himalayensis]
MCDSLQLETILAQAGIRADKETGALTTPLHFSTTYQHPEFGKSTGYDYTRTKNPTRASLEKTLAAIEGADYALATSSGMSAIVLAFSVFPVGSKVLAVRDLYGGSFRWFYQAEQEGRFQFIYANSEEELQSYLTEEIDVVYIETPTNPLMVEFDLKKIAELAHAKGARVVVDNTFYSPIYQQPLKEGADLVLHSATKYLSGHNDVLAGAIMTNSLEIYEQLFYNLNTTGAVLSPFDSYLLLRGLKTLALRMERATENAQKVVAFLCTHPAVKEVLYPGTGGMISFKIKDETRIPNFLNAIQVFTFAESLGGVESLITYPTTQTHADIPAEVRHSYGLTDDLLRLSIGIEASQDLIDDLAQALEK